MVTAKDYFFTWVKARAEEDGYPLTAEEIDETKETWEK